MSDHYYCKKGSVYWNNQNMKYNGSNDLQIYKQESTHTVVSTANSSPLEKPREIRSDNGDFHVEKDMHSKKSTTHVTSLNPDSASRVPGYVAPTAGEESSETVTGKSTIQYKHTTSKETVVENDVHGSTTEMTVDTLTAITEEGTYIDLRKKTVNQ
jgi:hypothetical protein